MLSVYRLIIVSFFLFHAAFILKRGFNFFKQKIQVKSHGILHYMLSADLSNSFSQLTVSILPFLNQ